METKVKDMFTKIIKEIDVASPHLILISGVSLTGKTILA